MRLPGITDMHCHILPGVDDGCRTMSETMKVLKEAEKQHISSIIVTPHYHPGRFEVSPAQIYEALEKIRRYCEDKKIHITFYPGHECYYYSELVSKLDSGEALTLAGSRYVLVEFEPDCLFNVLLTGLQDLKENGYIPVLAHFERYSCLHRDDKWMELKERGYLLQMNFDMLCQRDGLFFKNRWRTLMQAEVVDFLGSDCHGTKFRPLRVEEASAWMIKKLPKEYRKQVLYDNIQKIIKGMEGRNG